MRVLVPLAEGFEEIEAITIIDILRRAGVDCVTAGLSGYEVTGSHAVTVKADMLMSACGAMIFEAIVLPGGPGHTRLKESADVIDMIKKIHMRGGYCTAICAGPTVLARAGILAGKKVTCFPGEEQNLDGAVYTGSPVEIDGTIITGKGAGASVSFSLALVQAFVGEEKARDLRSRLQVYWND
jgi:4-methyl-5(b-hydroxyethyl)-thiazole monophosphate biosynthesis